MPLSPILLTPAFRHGKDTPWGGDRLRELFGKEIPEAPTGESLELSALPGLESRDRAGRRLPGLLAAYGEALRGTAVPADFPLLLKLLDAREALSVQLHPSSAYAGPRYGKQGKEEAWVILSAGPGAQLVLGFRNGVTKTDIENALATGDDLSDLLRFVPVRPGDAFLIPPGTVHAILGGIVLYEIQQSSDLTFRLHDWGRVGKGGKPREMHRKESLEVMDMGSRPRAAEPVRMVSSEQGTMEMLFACSSFELMRLSHCDAMELPEDTRRFSVLTCLSDAALECCGRKEQLKRGQTALLPADGYPLKLTCDSALLGFPAVT